MAKYVSGRHAVIHPGVMRVKNQSQLPGIYSILRRQNPLISARVIVEYMRNDRGQEFADYLRSRVL